MTNINLITVIPFIVLLILISVMPLTFPHIWEKNRNKALFSFVISLPILVYLLFNFPSELIVTGKDYFSFIVLLASLFIISGGILITGDLQATPRVNSTIILVGAVISNLVGTTGASMLLIRLLLRTNSERKFVKHIPVFFIFLVSNIGGLLTPIGDPPLFLGYLKGIPFTWTLRLFPVWLTAVILVLTIFYVLDSHYYHKETLKNISRDINSVERLKMKGKLNLLFLLGVILAILFIPSPYREPIMITMTVLSLIFTSKEIHTKNKFTFYAITEVAILFAGIFITMVPLIMLLHERGASLGITKPWQFFWLSGILSSFLDNAPTYLTFFSLGESVTRNLINVTTIKGIEVGLLSAISCGAVFMGANTYIGNGPNFMVKAIAEERKFPVPHFFEYMLYSGLILLPTFLVITFIFF